MAIAGYTCLVRLAGVSTTCTDEALSNISGAKYQITSEARRCLDPMQTWVFKDGGVAIPYASIATVDFLFGEVTLTAPAAGAVTFTGKFRPLTTSSEIVAEAYSYSITESTDVMDKTVFNDGRFRRKLVGLMDAMISMDIHLNSTDAPKLSTFHSSGGLVVVELNFGHTPLFRGVGIVDSFERSASVDGIVEGTATWTLAAERETVSGLRFPYGLSERSLTST